MARRVAVAKDNGEKKEQKTKFVAKIVWKNAIVFLALHLVFLQSVYLAFVVCHPFTFVWGYILASLSGIGITVGAHRLFSHRSYTANVFVRAVLLLGQTVAGQNCLYVWARDHRQHHKYSDTTADPHDSTRGFFFSHIGWLMVRKHPDVIRAGKHIDMSDLEADKLVMFQKKYYKTLYFTFAMILPVVVPCYFWGETFWNSFAVVYVGRYVYVLNITWLVNSAAHLFGTRPYDKAQAPRENRLVAFLGWGEGWHNYHHAFPWDYRTSEYGMKYNTNATIIEFLAKLGWVTELRSASKVVVMDKVNLKGDGSHGTLQAKTAPTTGIERFLEDVVRNLWHVFGALPGGLVVAATVYLRL